LKFDPSLGQGWISGVSYFVTLKMANLAKAKDAKPRVLALRDAEVRHHEGPRQPGCQLGILFPSWVAIMQIDLSRSLSALLATGGLIPFVFASLFLFFAGTADAACVNGINDKNGKPCGGGGDDDAKVDIDQLQHEFVTPVATTGSITGDGDPYVDAEDCVSGTTFSAGGTSLRTVTHADPCVELPRSAWRVLKMYLPHDVVTLAKDDLTQLDLDFDQDGVLAKDEYDEETDEHHIEEVPARLIISSPYASNPSAEFVSIWILKVVKSEQGLEADYVEQHSVPRLYQIEYEEPAMVEVPEGASSSRIVTMDADVGARICEDIGVKRRKGNPCDWGSPVGYIHSLPFKVTISPVPVQ
jgi:hypothetical protein